MGGMLFYRFLEYEQTTDHGESRIASDLRGAVWDLHLVARFIRAIGESFVAEDLLPGDQPVVEAAAKFAPGIEDLALQLEAALPPKGQ